LVAMTSEVVASVVAGGVALISGIALALYGSLKRLEVEYDIALRNHRIEAYQALWKILAPLAYYSPPSAVTYGLARDLSRALRSWYFEVGGLFLSELTREAYFDLQKGLGGVIKEPVEHDHLPVADKLFERLRGTASTLRTATTQDVATRVKPRRTALRMRTFLRRLPWRRQLEVTVRRGWLWTTDERECYTVLIENPRSRRTVKVSDVYFDGAKPLSVLERPMRLRRGGHWEMAVPRSYIPAASGDVRRRVRVEISGSKVIKSKPGRDVEPHPAFVFAADRPTGDEPS
jgi:hypothetical protein